MSDNTTINLGVGGDVIAADDIAGVKHQRVKVEFGADGFATDVSAATPLPVAVISNVGLTDTQIRATPLPVLNTPLSGTGSLTAAAQAVTLTLGGRYANTTFQVGGTYVGTLVFEATNDGTNFTTINALRAGDNTISQQISDSASNDIYRCTTAGFNSVRIRANSLTSGAAVVTALATESTSGVFLNFPLPAGTNTIGAVTGTFFQAVQPTSRSDVTATGTLSAAAQTVVLSMAGALSAASVQITGTWAGTIQFEGTLNGTDWVAINGVYAGSSFPAPTITSNGLVRLTPGGLSQVRVNMTAFTSGSATVLMRASNGVGGTFANQILPTRITDGTNIQAIKPASTAAVAADPAAVVSLSPNSPVTFPALVKGVQGSTGVMTQKIKDSGRVNVVISCYQALGIMLTEALFAADTFAISRDGGISTTGQQFTVTAGKRLVIQSVSLTIKDTSTTASTSKVVLRYSGAGGVISSTSPVLGLWDAGDASVTAGSYLGPYISVFPDGLELVGSSTFGVTNLASTTAVLHTITINGFEY